MLRICKYCLKEYEGDPGGSCCPECAAKQRQTTLRQRVCQTCGATFSGGPAARYCPACRAERIKEQKRRFRANGPARPLGSRDICKACGKEYVVESGKQMYCPECAPEQIRIKDRQKSLEWNRANTTPEQRREVRKAASAEIECRICGKWFIPTNAAQTCSPECSAALAKQLCQEWERSHKAERLVYHRELERKKLDAMTDEERRAYRDRINARERENYKKRQERKKAEEDNNDD